ncbi:aspartate aminotransferase-like [Mercenaria mercenaria]|uniref:aspartate aminotransferase-like n=1 Tax=Mercenaria mercenaria TaxID=6596 RepID=UPI00234F634E|nr:aspartate aminotransferase-like [Mercenaria mercenaria]XP_053408146.1 aspartate aminotransferase-like [Mercenaria mercenaria]
MATLVRDTLENYSAASNLMHNEKIREMMGSGQTIYHFGFGQSPFPIMDKAADKLKKHASEAAYLPVAGIEELRAAIRDFHKKYDAISFSSDDVIVGPGSKELIFLLMNIFQGDILVISPSWTSYKPQVMLSGHKANIVPTTMEDEWKIKPEKFTQYLKENNLSGTKLLIMNNPDNPTGTLYTQQELSDLSDVFKRHNVIVLSDEIYGRLTFDDSFVSMAKVYPEGTILCSGMSKWASMGGWRLGYHVYPPQLSSLKNAVKSAASHTYTTVAAPIQYAVAEVLRDLDTCDAYMRHTTRIMAAVGQYCHKELAEVGVHSIRPKGGFYIFPNLEILKPKLKARGIERCEDMVNALFEETSVSVMAGGPAFLRPETELTVRLCYVNFDGAKALAESERIGLGACLPDNFVQTQCSHLHEGIQALKQWIKKILES